MALGTNPSLGTLHEYTTAAARIKSLERIWQLEIIETDRRRNIRYVNLSVEQMRTEGRIKMDATYIPRRVADSNIRREQAPFISYMTQSRDVAKFRSTDKLPIPPEPLEREFTGFAQYDRWQIPFFQAIDGGQTHGWDGVETLFDPTKPGHFMNRHIGHDNLWFAWDVLNIQESPLAVIVIGVTTTQLMDYVNEYDFSSKMAEEVRLRAEAQENKPETKIRLFKVYYKDEQDGLVYLAWYSEWASDWLKAPEKFTLDKVDDGGLPIYEMEYPIEPFLYTVSENEIITDTKGRVFFDEHDQEACTQLVTAYVNKALRSSYLMFAPTAPQDDTAEKQTEIKIGDGMIFSQAMSQFTLDPPESEMLNAMMTITNQNANELGQVNYAVTNRKDSRKTATEIQTANQQSAMLNSVQVTMLSIFLRNVWTRCWDIACSQVQQGKIESAIPNWEVYYNRNYTLLAAGDIDVVRRSEIVQAMKQDWPVIQNTAAAQPFLEDIVRMSPYSENADKYITAMEQGNKKDNLIRGMATALKTIAVDPATGQLKPDLQQFKPQLMELQQEYQQVMTPLQQQGQGQQDQTQQPEQPTEAAA